MQRSRWMLGAAVPMALAALAAPLAAPPAVAQTAPAPGPSVVDPSLEVTTTAAGLSAPTSMAFLDRDTALVLEKATGRVQRLELSGGTAAAPTTVLDLPVNSASERGLLGIAVHPRFPRSPYVYLYWTESTSGTDSTALPDVPLLGNRVDRFRWDGTALSLDKPLIALRARQHDATNLTTTTPPTVVERGNHNGGKIAFGTDGKLFVQIGDEGRRGQLQNLPDGPGCIAAPCPAIPRGNQPDDQYGGPEPDDAHLTGVVLRLEDDGDAPRDNPFYRAGVERGGEVGENYKRIWSYGVRNGFGLAVDPFSGALWDAQNGDDSFSEVNRIPAGSNLGWVQAMGPLSRAGQFKTIETDRTTVDAGTGQTGYFGLQQTRFDPTNLAGSAREALARMFTVRSGATEFAASLDAQHEVPTNDSGASGRARFELNRDGSLDYSLDVEQLSDARMAHIHLGGAGQNGPVVVTLFADPAGVSTYDDEVIARGRIEADDVDEALLGTAAGAAELSELLRRLQQGRAYVNVHTSRFPGGEIRGQIVATDGKALSHYQDPQLSWTYEVAPVGLGFLSSTALGSQYRGDMFLGAARNLLQGGQLFRVPLSRDRRSLAPQDRRLRDRVADNRYKYDVTESESLLFGTNFGVVTDIQTGPDGSLYVLSNNTGTLYEIDRR